MKHTTSTDLRKTLSAMMDRVNEDHEPVIVTRAKGEPVVMIPPAFCQVMADTAIRLTSPADAGALRAVTGRGPCRLLVAADRPRVSSGLPCDAGDAGDRAVPVSSLMRPGGTFVE